MPLTQVCLHLGFASMAFRMHKTTSRQLGCCSPQASWHRPSHKAAACDQTRHRTCCSLRGGQRTDCSLQHIARAGSRVVEINFNELKDHETDLVDKIEAAYGPNGLGILTVSGVPGYEVLRRSLLPLAEGFFSLPKGVLKQYVHPDSSYAVGIGWGRKAGPDLTGGGMGSYYVNVAKTEDLSNIPVEIIQQYPQYFTSNIWPTEDMPELQPALMALAECMVQAGVLLAEHCRRYMLHRLIKQGDHILTPELQAHLDFAGQLRASNTHKGRLIWYPPQAGATETWCGRHMDFGALTALASPMYLQAGREVPKPDPAAGLYVVDRNGTDVQVEIPAGHIAFQVGRVLGIQTGGCLRPTAHYVRAPAEAVMAPGVSRNTFVVFLQPSVDTPLVAPNGAAALQREFAAEAGPNWYDGISFGEFAQKELGPAAAAAAAAVPGK